MRMVSRAMRSRLTQSLSDDGDKDGDDLPPYAGACAIAVDYSDNHSNLSDSEGSCATDDPHLDCCISRPGKLGGDRAAERLSEVVYPRRSPNGDKGLGEETDSSGISDRHRFCIHHVQNDQRVIIDTARPFDEGVLIDTCLLVDRWYWRNRAEASRRGWARE